MRTELKIETGQHETILDLLNAHQSLKNLVDKMFAEAWRTNAVESIIEIRSLNAKCISKYTDLSSNNELTIESSNEPKKKNLFSLKERYDLWKLNTQLSKMIPLYQTAMRNPNISGFVRMLISFNFENLLRVKDNLLHPVDESLAV